MPRQTKYERDNWGEKLEVVEGWARDGLTDEQIAQKMGISRSTLATYKNKYPDFLNALKKGKEVVDRKVENALLKRALGYEIEETKKIISESGSQKKRIEKKTKHIKPDTTAQIFWLKNRKPELWRENEGDKAKEKLNEVVQAMKKAAGK